MRSALTVDVAWRALRVLCGRVSRARRDAVGRVAGGDRSSGALDNLQRIGGHAVDAWSARRASSQTDIGPAVEFDGMATACSSTQSARRSWRASPSKCCSRPMPTAPRSSASSIFRKPPARIARWSSCGCDGRRWALDTYPAIAGDAQLTLLDRARTHAAGDWHVATLTFDGTTMTHYVDGVREQRATSRSRRSAAAGRRSACGRTSVSWFKGRIAIDCRGRAGRRCSVIPLWPEGVPDAKTDGGDERIGGRPRQQRADADAHLLSRRPAQPNGTAVIVVPGRQLRAARDGERSRRASPPLLTPRGVATFVLKYRLAEYGHPAPLQDVLRAIRLVRSRAARVRRRPDRIGVLGASAGGHLAACRGHAVRCAGRTAPARALDAMSARPDFVALLYPVITMSGRSRTPTRGATCSARQPPAARVDRLSLETRVRANSAAGLHRPLRRRQQRADREQPGVLRRRCDAPACRRNRISTSAASTDSAASRTWARRRGWTARWAEWMRAHGWLPAIAGAGGARARRATAAWGARHRRPAQGRSRQRHVPQSDPGRRSSRPVDPERRRRLLHDVLVVRRVSRAS